MKATFPVFVLANAAIGTAQLKQRARSKTSKRNRAPLGKYRQDEQEGFTLCGRDAVVRNRKVIVLPAREETKKKVMEHNVPSCLERRGMDSFLSNAF